MIKAINYISQILNIQNRELIEKDLILHSFLKGLVEENYFRKNFVFKGGTCLTKCYLGYYRFSEDLDFSWINQDIFSDKSQKQIRKNLSKEINDIMELIKKISLDLNLDFDTNKKDKKYIEFGGSNKFVTFKIWYKSEVLVVERFFKIQINFIEDFEYTYVTKKAKSLIQNIDEKEINFLFPNFNLSLEDISLKCYDIKEILVEKIRAILTRKAVKARDFIDVFIILELINIKLDSFEKKIISKIEFMLKYEKYLENIMSKESFKFRLGEEEKLLLRPINERFYPFLDDFYVFLDKLKEKIK